MKRNKKKIIVSLFFFGLLSMPVQILNSQVSNIGSGKTICVGSSDPDNNTGYCEALPNGGGDKCQSFGSGPRCGKTVTVNF